MPWLAESGRTPEEELFSAVYRGNVSRVAAFAADGMDVDGTIDSATDTTPLMLAAMGGKTALVRWLLEYGVDINRRASNGTTALHYAASHGNEPVARLLLERGADPNVASEQSHSSRSGATPLMRAAERGADGHDILLLLLEHGADVDARDVDGRTALHHAFEGYVEGRREAVEDLIGAGAKPDVPDKWRKWTPLMLAAQQGRLESLRSLLAAGADPRAVDADGYRADEQAESAEESKAAELLRAAIETRGDPVSAAVMMRQPDLKVFRTTIEADDAAKVADLLAGGADVNHRFSGGESALVVAVKQGRPEVVRALLDAGADVGVSDETGGTALLYADRPEIIRLLIGAGADVNFCPDDYAWTPPLLNAVFRGDLESVELLLAAGANPDRPFSEGAGEDGGGYEVHATPLIAAAYAANEREIADALIRAGATVDERTRPFLNLLHFGDRAATPEYQAWVTRLTELCGGRDDAATERLPGVYSFDVADVRSLAERYGAGATFEQVVAEDQEREAKFDRILGVVQEEVRADGFHLVRSGYRMAGRPATLMLFPTPDKYAVIAAVGTSGNGAVPTPEVVRWLQEMETEQPWVLMQCEHDTLAGRFLTPVKDPEGLAERMYEFCSDIIDQGLEDEAALAEELRTKGTLYFWWD
jgi:ankyrin repeat protein